MAEIIERQLLTYIPLDALLTTMSISKEFEKTTRRYIARCVESGETIFHRGVDLVFDLANSSEEEQYEFIDATKERHKLVTQVIFLQNLPRIGDYACYLAANLVVVEIPDGLESIGDYAFSFCQSLTTVSFPTTLTSIGRAAFAGCSSLDNVDLLNTNLQELKVQAFGGCSELKSMTIPDSLQTISVFAFIFCSKLVPSKIHVTNQTIDTTPEVVAHLRSEMSLNALLSGNNFLNTDDFRRLIVPYLSNDALMAIRLASKPWSRVVDEFIDDSVESGAITVRGEEDLQGSFDDFKERHECVTRVIFLLNITKFGGPACAFATNLVVVDYP
ncbi:hypothetical protein TL16_g11194 [Triparma laevis f. inornata]|uniref:Uncharacterized protein n=1 Tax=Triparma laevis f. inornata TaxID=1714386 RepID=A0A9W7BKA8_9STRA|nr:hypothetical protein TL16_g11194 [Triparma laevis f. inornata]